MTKSKSKRKTKPRPSRAKSTKPKTKRGNYKGPRPARNYAKLDEQWLASTLSMAAFCRLHKMANETGRQNLTSVKKKNSIIKSAMEKVPDFVENLKKDMAKSEAKLYVSALRLVRQATERILLDATGAFVELPGRMHPRESGSIALAAGKQLISVSAELQGIPDEKDAYSWPIDRGFSPFSYQRDFIHDTPSSIALETGETVFIFAFVGGVGSGKTYCGAQKAGKLADLNRGCMGMILAPTYKMLEDSTKPAFFKAIAEKGLSYNYKKSENSILLFGDTRIIFRSMDEPAHLAGPDVAWAWIDEGLLVNSREAFDIINARIRGDEKPEKALILTSTPDGLTWGYDVLVSDADQNKVRMYKARTQDNPVLGDYYDRLLSSYDPKYAKQQLDAMFLNVHAGLAYESFSEVDSVFDPRSIDRLPGMPLDLQCDFNVAPMCWNVSQDHKQNGDVFTYVFDEIHLEGSSTQRAIGEFIERYRGHNGGVRVYGDATGRSRSTKATRSDYEIIEQELKKAGMRPDIYVGRSNPRVADSVNSLNARLENAKGDRRLFINRDLKYTIRDFQRTSWIPNSRQLDKSNKEQTHHTDAIRYRAQYEWPIFGIETYALNGR